MAIGRLYSLIKNGVRPAPKLLKTKSRSTKRTVPSPNPKIREGDSLGTPQEAGHRERLRKYRLTPQQYARMLKDQKGRCAIGSQAGFEAYQRRQRLIDHLAHLMQEWRT